MELVRKASNFSLNRISSLEPLQDRFVRFDVVIGLGLHELSGKKIGHVDVVFVLTEPVLFPSLQEICDRSFPVDYAYLAGNVRTRWIERRDGSCAFPSEHVEHMPWQYGLMAIEHKHPFSLKSISQEV